MKKEKFNELAVEAGFNPKVNDVIACELTDFTNLLLDEVIKQLKAKYPKEKENFMFYGPGLAEAINTIEAMKCN
jgi:hypothetical protein